MMGNNNYFQVIELSDDEQIKLYMKQPKHKLAEMLLQANKMLKLHHPKISDTQKETNIRIDENEYWLGYINRFASHVPNHYRRANKHNFLDRIKELKDETQEPKGNESLLIDEPEIK